MTREEAVVVLEALMKNPLFSEVHKVAFNIAIHDIKAYHKWNLNELVLTQKDNEQEPILDKIRAEIEQTTSRYCISRERGGSGQVEWSDRLIKESEVLEIIDKYKSKTEVKDESTN